MVLDEEQSGISRRTYLKFTGTAAASATLAGCTGGDEDPAEETDTELPDDNPGGQDDDSSVTITLGQLDSGLDPHDHRETPTDIICMQAYEGTLGRDPEGGIIESLAEDWERVEEGRVRLSLRDDVTFHSGDELTPEDVAFSINRIVDPDAGDLESPQADQLAGVTEATPVDGEDAVEVISDSANPTVFGLLASYGDIVQKSWIEDRDTDEINSDMNGTGPYRLENYTEDEQIEYSRFEDYWDGTADVAELTINASSEDATRVNQLVSGETDIVTNVPPQEAGRVKGGDDTRLEAVPSTRVIYNAMRYDVEPFSSVEFRQAMNYAVDVESIIENVLSGFADPTSQPTLEGFIGYNPDTDLYPYDPDEAESLVEESGHAGAEIELHSPAGRYLKDIEIAQAVVNYVDELPNVSCSLNQRDFGSLAGELTSGDIENMPRFYLIGWGNETFDADQTLTPLLTSDGALSSYSNDEFDDLVEQARGETDEDQREELLREANQFAHDEAPWIFLNRQYSVYGVDDGLEWTPRQDEAIKAYDISTA